MYGDIYPDYYYIIFHANGMCTTISSPMILSYVHVLSLAINKAKERTESAGKKPRQVINDTYNSW